MANKSPACLSCRPLSLGRRSFNCRPIPRHFILVAESYSCEFLPILSFSSSDYTCSAVFLPALFSMSEIPSLFALRPIVQRHHKAAMYHPFVEAIALTLVDMPVTFIIILLYSIVLYFLVGLQRTAGQFLCVISISPVSILRFGFPQ